MSRAGDLITSFSYQVLSRDRVWLESRALRHAPSGIRHGAVTAPTATGLGCRPRGTTVKRRVGLLPDPESGFRPNFFVFVS